MRHLAVVDFGVIFNVAALPAIPPLGSLGWCPLGGASVAAADFCFASRCFSPRCVAPSILRVWRHLWTSVRVCVFLTRVALVVHW